MGMLFGQPNGSKECCFVANNGCNRLYVSRGCDPGSFSFQLVLDQVVPRCDSPLRIAKFSKPAAPSTTGKFRGRRAILALRLAPGKLLLQASLCSTLRLSCQGATAAQL